MGDIVDENLTPWKNGYYHMRGMPSMLYLVEGENILVHPASGKPQKTTPSMKGSLKYGDFGEANEDVAKESGKSRYNVQMVCWEGMWKPKLVLSDDGKRIGTFSS